jgi:hypothetical protein
MKTARYRTKWGAERYAAELARKHPGRTFTVVPHPYDPFYAYAVKMEQDNGRPAYAARRPNHFGKENQS